MSKYGELSEFIIENVGGKENIEGLTHCLTRLRFNLKDISLVNEEALKNKKGIATAQAAGGQYQVVIGTHVGDVYEEIIEKIGNKKLESDDVKKGILNSAISVITKTITPLLGCLIGCGLIQGLLSILTFTGLVNENSGTYLILYAMGQGVFQFFPVLVGYSASKAFKLDPAIGVLIGSILLFPGLTESMTQGNSIMTLFANTPFSTDVFQTFFGIPIMFPSVGYNSAVIPTIIIVYMASKLNGFLKRHIPTILEFTLVPFFTILITIPVSLLIVGPVLNLLMQLIGAGVTAAYNFSTIFASVVVALIYQPLVIMGLHWPLITIAMQNYGTVGYDVGILPTLFSASFAQLAVVAAVFVRTKSKELKDICLPAMVSALFCIIEPAIYGVTLPVKKRFGFSMIGGAVGAAIMCSFGAISYAPLVGIFGFVSYLNPKTGDVSGFIVAIIGVAIAMVVAFLLTYFTFKDEKEPDGNIAANEILPDKEIILTSPLEGIVSNIETAQDTAFSKGLLGEGALIHPTIGKVVAPCDGKIIALFPTGHAIGITSVDGVEILIHLGKDTVHLNGKHFNPLKNQDDYVRQGETIVEFDIKAIEEDGFLMETPVIITNTDKFSNIIITSKDKVSFSDELIYIEKSSPTINEGARI